MNLRQNMQSRLQRRERRRLANDCFLRSLHILFIHLNDVVYGCYSFRVVLLEIKMHMLLRIYNQANGRVYVFSFLTFLQR